LDATAGGLKNRRLVDRASLAETSKDATTLDEEP
jgi:hypothetical protein